MKALIFNSGLGTRLGDYTKEQPKCMIKLYNGESIFERQIRILSECGIKNFIVTTGPFEEQLKEVAKKYSDLNFKFVKNSEYKTTNYIVSMYKTRKYIDDDMLVLHGDLVFNKDIVLKLLENKCKSLCLYNENKPLPEKDFKGMFEENKLLQVSIHIFKNCYAFQPLYKLSHHDMSIWIEKVVEFVEIGETKVYAENALNETLWLLNIQGLSYKDDYVEEIDNEEDYKRVSCEIKKYDKKQ